MHRMGALPLTTISHVMPDLCPASLPAPLRPLPHTFWCDTHVHMDDARFACADAVREAARAVGVQQVLIPAIGPVNFRRVVELAQRWGDACALGIHPMYIPADADTALHQLEQLLHQYASSQPHQTSRTGSTSAVVAVGEIGLDGFEPHLRSSDMQRLQSHCLRRQLQLAQRFDLPVLLHTRQAVDAVLKHLRQTSVRGGIAHAFTGSLQQARQFIDMGFKIGLGGAITFDRAQRLRKLATELPLEALVLETDAPDIVPSWVYVPAADRAAGHVQPPNQPAHIPRIAQVLAELRGLPLDVLQQQLLHNVAEVLPAWAQRWSHTHIGSRP